LHIAVWSIFTVAVCILTWLEMGFFWATVGMVSVVGIHNARSSRDRYAGNFKFGMKVALNKRSKKIMLNNQWLPWLPCHHNYQKV